MEELTALVGESKASLIINELNNAGTPANDVEQAE
jgi:hypothetical protein